MTAAITAKMGRMTEADKIEALVDYGRSMLVLGVSGKDTTVANERQAKKTSSRVFQTLVGRKPTKDEILDLVVE